MNKTKLLAALLSLALVFSACGGAASSESNVAHNHATEITTEVTKEEVATELATELVDNLEATEMVDTETTKTDATETVVAEKEDTKDKTETDAPNKDASNNSSNKDSTTGGNANTGTNSGSNGSGASKPGSTEKPNTEKDTEKPVTPEKPEKDTEKPAPDTEKPVEDGVCKHTNTAYGGGNGYTHDIICRDCLLNKDEIVVLRTEACNFSSGTCKCGVACQHKSITEIVESTDKSGRCGWSCNACGFTSLLNHNVVWLGNYEGCTRCSTTWACTHGHGANIYAITDASGHLMACNLCQTTIAEGPHTYANGSCTVCGWAEPIPETEAPAPEPEPTPEPEAPVTTEAPVPETPVVEDGVTSVEVAMMWNKLKFAHICRHH